MKPEFARTARVLGTLGIVGVYALLSLGSEAATSKADAKISDLSCDADVGIVNGEPDAGVRVTFIATNAGEAGAIEVMPRVSTSEGEWQRDQTLHFGAGESKSLTYFFHEPTINANNINCNVRAIP